MKKILVAAVSALALTACVGVPPKTEFKGNIKGGDYASYPLCCTPDKGGSTE